MAGHKKNRGVLSKETPRGGVEAAGIEPASASPSTTDSTCVVREKVSRPSEAHERPHPDQPPAATNRDLATSACGLLRWHSPICDVSEEPSGPDLKETGYVVLRSQSQFVVGT